MRTFLLFMRQIPLNMRHFCITGTCRGIRSPIQYKAVTFQSLLRDITKCSI